jgi:very-short-patch-repair endonuclease
MAESGSLSDTNLPIRLLEIAHAYGRDAEKEMYERLMHLPCVAAGRSPIETMMGCALYYFAFLESPLGPHGLSGDTCFSPDVDVPLESASRPRFDGFHINYQVRVGRYVADFVVNMRCGPKEIAAAIECDGHDYHERTAEQAEYDRKRDRDFQARGLMVLRYPGAEITRAPIRAAKAALDTMRARAAQE